MNWFEEVMETPSINELFEKIKSHHKPVAMLGAGRDARLQTEILKQHKIDVEIYFVEKDYFKPNMTFQNKQVLCFEEMSEKQAEKYVFVLGLCLPEYEEAAERFFSKTKIIKYALPPLDVFGIPEPINHGYIKEQFSKFNETYNMLSDDLSCKTFKCYLQGKISADFRYNQDICCNDVQYFIDLMIPYNKGIFFDCGAYIGDTVSDFITWSKGNYKKIYAVEADRENFEELTHLVRENDYQNVVLINKGVWNKQDVLALASGMGKASPSVNEHGTEKIMLDTIDNIVGEDDITFIKMDIEGSELNALCGAEKTIKRCKPALAVCVYHRAADLITIPQFIKSCETDDIEYKFYLRKYFRLSTAGDVVLYAVPTKKNNIN